MAKKSFAEQLIDALKKDDVAEILAKALDPFITLRAKELFRKSTAELIADNKTLKSKMQQLETENTQLKSRLASLDERSEGMDRECREKNIVIRGLPEVTFAERGSASSSEDDSVSHHSVTSTVCKLLMDDMGLNVSAEDLTAAFRMRAGPRDRVRPLW